MSYTLYQATYDLNVTYHNNVQSVNVAQVANGEKVTYLNDISDHNAMPAVNRNLIAVKDALINLLKGYLGPDTVRGNTFIDQSTLVTVDDNGNMQFDISPARMEELLQNVTISVLSVSPSNISTTILWSNTANFYTFYRPINLLLPYSLSLTAAIFFIVLGLLALKSNGISASSGGFLQTLTTARASETLNHVAEKSSPGGRENTATHLRVFHIVFYTYILVRCIDMDSSDFF